MVETGAAELAALHATDEDRERMELDAIRTRNPEVARKAMQAHINQTYDDHEHFIHPEEQQQETT